MSSINYAAAFGINSVAAAVIFAVLYLPFGLWCVLVFLYAVDSDSSQVCEAVDQEHDLCVYCDDAVLLKSVVVFLSIAGSSFSTSPIHRIYNPSCTRQL